MKDTNMLFHERFGKLVPTDFFCPICHEWHEWKEKRPFGNLRLCVSNTEMIIDGILKDRLPSQICPNAKRNLAGMYYNGVFYVEDCGRRIGFYTYVTNSCSLILKDNYSVKAINFRKSLTEGNVIFAKTESNIYADSFLVQFKLREEDYRRLSFPIN